MTEVARGAPLNVIRANSRYYVAIGDLVAMCRSMAADVDSAESTQTGAAWWRVR